MSFIIGDMNGGSTELLAMKMSNDLDNNEKINALIDKK